MPSKTSTLLLLLFWTLMGCSSEKTAYQEAAELNTAEGYKAFLSEHPSGEFAEQARGNLEELEWTVATADGTLQAYEDLLRRHPEGRFSGAATEAVAGLRFARAKEVRTIEAYEQFLATHPTGKYSDKALEAVKEIRFETAIQENTESAYERFLTDYPDDPLAARARLSLAKLKKPRKQRSTKPRLLIRHHIDTEETALPIAMKVSEILAVVGIQASCCSINSERVIRSFASEHPTWGNGGGFRYPDSEKPDWQSGSFEIDVNQFDYIGVCT